MRRAWLVVAMFLAVAGCSRKPAETDAAVRQAVERYLASRSNLNMGAMDLSVGSIVFRGDKAEAEVTFRSKNDAKASMSMRYKLRRQGNQWEVEPQPAAETSGSGVPAGHPPVGSAPAQPELPAGHPPVQKK